MAPSVPAAFGAVQLLAHGLFRNHSRCALSSIAQWLVLAYHTDIFTTVKTFRLVAFVAPPTTTATYAKLQ